MRVLTVLACLTCLFPMPLAAEQRSPAHPSEVAFVEEGAKGHVYRKFPTGERLYVSDNDVNGQSSCIGGCATAWPPVYAPADAEPVGEWTVVRRIDGKTQWALAGRPVYTRFHDSAEVATGDGVDGVWHIVDYVTMASHPASE